MELNWIDKAIEFVSPQRGLRRAQARLAVELLSAYEGAKIGRRTEGWITAGTDANAALLPDLARLRQRSHDLVRNNPIARRAVSVIVSSAIGTGIIPQAATADSDLNKRIDDAFWRWSDAKECDGTRDQDFFGLQHLNVRAMVESGAALVRLRQRRPGDGLSVPLQLQTMEADHIDLSAYGNRSGGVTVNGIEFNAIGTRVGYYLLDTHPGASGIVASGGRTYQSRFVPDSEVVHAFRKERPEQVHGVPWLASAMLLLRDMDDYNEAELLRAKTAACLSVLVTQTDISGIGLGQRSTEEGTANRLEKLRPGMVAYLRPGEDVKPIVPTGHANFAEYMKFLLHIVAVALDLHYTQASGDLTAVNYSSYRAGDRDFRGAIEAFRWLYVIPMFLQPIWNRFIDTAAAAGVIPARDYAVNWHPPQFMSVDPVKDATSDELEMSNGTLAWPDAVARKGVDPAKQLIAIVDWAKQFDAAGMTFGFDRRRVTSSGAKQTSPSGDPVSALADLVTEAKTAHERRQELLDRRGSSCPR